MVPVTKRSGRGKTKIRRSITRRLYTRWPESVALASGFGAGRQHRVGERRVGAFNGVSGARRMSVDPLPPSRLIRRCDPAALGFATTADLQPVTGMVGQERAGEAVRFAVEMTRDGYNLFALGPEGIGRST